MYNVFKAYFNSLLDTIDGLGFRNPNLSGQDLQLNSDILPPHMFTRMLSLDFFYENTVPKLESHPIINAINFNSNFLNNES